MKKPTIEQLEAMLQEENLAIQINPDGSIEAVKRPDVQPLEKVLSEIAGARVGATY